jgi:hypothetical protein
VKPMTTKNDPAPTGFLGLLKTEEHALLATRHLPFATRLVLFRGA